MRKGSRAFRSSPPHLRPRARTQSLAWATPAGGRILLGWSGGWLPQAPLFIFTSGGTVPQRGGEDGGKRCPLAALPAVAPIPGGLAPRHRAGRLGGILAAVHATVVCFPPPSQHATYLLPPPNVILAPVAASHGAPTRLPRGAAASRTGPGGAAAMGGPRGGAGAEESIWRRRRAAKGARHPCRPQRSGGPRSWSNGGRSAPAAAMACRVASVAAAVAAGAVAAERDSGLTGSACSVCR